MNRRDDDLCWRVERALQMAWPALAQQRCGDWLARFAPGVSRRSNSANPTRATFGDIDADIAACEALYRERGASPLFRVPAIVLTVADEKLDRLNYAVEGETITLFAELSPSARRDSSVTIARQPDAEWLAAMTSLQGQSPEQARIYRQVVEALAIAAGFVSLCVEGERVAVAYGAIHDGLLCVESVVVDAGQRGRGHGRAMMNALLAWSAEQGARAACLQVAADNGAGLALYGSLGLTAELYRYHYRRGPEL